MSPDEHERELLRRRLAQHLDDETAGLLMERLPPHRWDELATKADIDELRGEFTALRGEFTALRTEVREDFDAFRTEMALRLESTENKLLAAFRGELNTAVTSQTRTMIFTMAGSLVALAGLSMTLGQLG